MLDRKNVSALMNEIIANLNLRLKKYPHKILTEAQYQGSTKYQYCLRCNNGNYIVFTSELKFHKTELTLHRMRNVYNIRELSNQQLTDVLKDKSEELNKRLDKIQELLDLGIAINKQISNEFGVSHVTYQENRLAGHNMFTSRVNTAWTGSRTQRVFEKSLTRLEDFKKTFGLSVPHSSAPPAYAVSMPTKTI